MESTKNNPKSAAGIPSEAYRRALELRGSLMRWVRRRRDAPEDANYIVQKSDFGIRVADVRSHINRVEMLVTRMYRQRGYVPSTSSTEAEADSPRLRQVTLEACRGNQTVGTITVSLDSAEGLHAEELYREEIAPYRARGARLCEFNRLALDVEQCGKDALGYLFHLAVIFAYRIHKATDLFIEVNPRHAVFYRRKLGFKLVGEEKVCRRVNAPAVLLHHELSAIAEQIVRYGGLRVSQDIHNNKSFYSFFMPPWEEKDLIGEIRELLARSELPPEQGAKVNAA